MTEPGQQGQQGDGGQGQPTGGTGQPVATHVPQPDTNAIAAAARRDGETDGYQKAARELGVSVEEAKGILADHKKRSDAEKSAQDLLKDRDSELSTAKEQTSNEKKRADRYEKIIKANVDSQIEALPDDIKDLLSNFDVAGQFEWLTKHGSKYAAGDEGTTPDEGQTGTRRAPDASRTQKIPGLDESSQNFNDLLRARGLSSGVS